MKIMRIEAKGLFGLFVVLFGFGFLLMTLIVAPSISVGIAEVSKEVPFPLSPFVRFGAPFLILALLIDTGIIIIYGLKFIPKAIIARALLTVLFFGWLGYLVFNRILVSYF